MSGWIKIHRDILYHEIWSDKPFSKGQAWIDLILLANHSDNKCMVGNKVEEIKRGSFITSELKLMDRWGITSQQHRDEERKKQQREYFP